MNKIFLALSILSLGLGACSQQKKSDLRDSSTVVESLQDDTLEVVADSVPNQSVDTLLPEKKTIYTDAWILNAKGNVKKLVESHYASSGEKEWSNTYNFDSKGKLLSVNGYKVKITRDREGRIKTLRYEEDVFEEDGNGYMSHTYTYNKDGEVASYEEDTGYSGGRYVNKYDKLGRVILRRYDDALGGGETIKFSYPSSAVDPQDNWTKATRTVDGNTTTITRDITYQK